MSRVVLRPASGFVKLGPGFLRSWITLLSIAIPGWLPAQRTDTERDTMTIAACTGAPVTLIEYDPLPPPLAGERMPGVIRPVMRALLQHRQTRPTAITPFLLVKEGDACTLDRLAESERLLRAQPYLADARIRASTAADGGVMLQVETVDEIPVIIGGALRDGSVSRVRFGNGNVLGYGALASVTWEQGFAYRDGIGLRLAHYHLVGRAAAELTLMRGTFQEEYGVRLTRPWLTDAQHVAWHLGAARREGFFQFLRPDEPALSLGIQRDYLDAGALLRIGRSARRMMAGLVASYERIDPAAAGIVIADTGFAMDDDTVLAGRYANVRDARLGAIVGGRWIAYREMIGLDSLAGRQDVATGVQLALTGGHGLSRGRRDPFGILDLYVAGGGGETLIALHAIAEARFRTASDWEDVVASGQIVWYGKPSPRRTRVVRTEFGGEWDATLPLQLTISDRAGGLRGYRGAVDAGARRLVLRLEERLSVGGAGNLAGFGVAGFADVGKLWAGDAPFGSTTGLRSSVGLGLLLSVPRRSQRLYRLDFAVPLVREGPTRSWSLRLSAPMSFETFWRDPGDVRRMRAQGTPGGLLRWQ